MRLGKRSAGFSLIILALTGIGAWSPAQPGHGKVELIRDFWGIPHVFADSDAGAMYGLGYATAEERGFQMTYALRIIQGRLAEILGIRQKPGRRETTVESDRMMRTFGWSRAAARTAERLDTDTRKLLQAYCDGVNASFDAQKKEGRLHPLFKELGVEPEPWKPADCLLSWWHLAQFFAGDGTRDLMVLRNRRNPPPGAPAPGMNPRWADDSAAVVQREDVSGQWLQEISDFAKSKGVRELGSGTDGPKFSHAWVVGGRKTTTGSAVLVSDPQTPVRNPSLWMEFHVSGKTFDARGVGVPGSPGLLIGFNRKVAWGLTALGADQADLFQLETGNDRPNEYLWDGSWRKMATRTEQIIVKGGEPIDLVVKETHVGPVVSAFALLQPGDPDVALKRIPICEPERDTIQGVFEMMRSRDSAEFRKALGGWRFPSANCVFGDSAGRIGFSVIGAIPLRSRKASDPNGSEAVGSGDSFDWQGFVPQELVPQVVDPKAGFLLSANHRPAGAFYPIPLGISTGSMGDTIRSWRLRELLSAKPKFTPEEVLGVHFDAVNPARREIARLGLHLRDANQEGLSPEASQAVEVLEKWLRDGASSDLRSAGASLATRISTFFRFVTTPLALKYGGGESGLARFLKDAAARVRADPKALFDEQERRFIDLSLSEAWRNDPGARRAGVAERPAKLGWFDSLDGFGSLNPERDLAVPGITCLDGQTIHSQAAQSYTQWVPLHDVDSARAICPIGHSDRLDSRFRTSTMDLWGQARLHDAPLSYAVVEKIAAERRVLSR